MSRKMTKSILSRDEITLFKHSEELKNTELYGNLYSVLTNISNLKSITINELIELGLNDIGVKYLLKIKRDFLTI